jgi:hypothetical protein
VNHHRCAGGHGDDADGDDDHADARGGGRDAGHERAQPGHEKGDPADELASGLEQADEVARTAAEAVGGGVERNAELLS